VVLLIAAALWARIGVSLLVQPPGAVTVYAHWGFFSYQLFPLNPKKKSQKPKNQRKANKRKEAEVKNKPPMDVRLMALLGIRTLQKLIRRIRVDWLNLHVVAGAGDAARTAVLYGLLHMGLGLASPWLTHIKRKDVTLGLDYSLLKPDIHLHTGISLHTASLLAIVLSALASFLKLRRDGRRVKRA
jgi:hypothetical protein